MNLKPENCQKLQRWWPEQTPESWYTHQHPWPPPISSLSVPPRWAHVPAWPWNEPALRQWWTHSHPDQIPWRSASVVPLSKGTTQSRVLAPPGPQTPRTLLAHCCSSWLSGSGRESSWSGLVFGPIDHRRDPSSSWVRPPPLFPSKDWKSISAPQTARHLASHDLVLSHLYCSLQECGEYSIPNRAIDSKWNKKNISTLMLM